MPELLRKIASRLGERQLVWAVNLLLLLLVMQALADMTWRWLEKPREEKVSQSVATTPVTSGPSAQVLAQQIANWHLFGQAQSVVTTSGPTVAPETKLNLVLRGVIASPSQEEAVAIIAAGVKAAEKSYGIGDSLPSGAKLKEIYGDRVIIEYRGRVETLTLHRKKLSNKELSIK
jgi:general secretion pathway protein C